MVATRAITTTLPKTGRRSQFRFWKRRRTAEEIGRYWHTHIDGGTNTDDNKYSLENRKVDIGVYYKFNEGFK